MSLQGQKNVYVCRDCKQHIVTVDRVMGTAPMTTSCVFKCTPKEPSVYKHGIMESRWYRVDQMLEPTHEWFKPSYTELKLFGATEAVKQHVARGGLMLRPIKKD